MQLIEQVAAQARLTRAQSNGVVNALLQAVVEALTQGHGEFAGLGNVQCESDGGSNRAQPQYR